MSIKQRVIQQYVLGTSISVRLCTYIFFFSTNLSDESLSPDQWEAVSSKTRVAYESNLIKRSVSKIISHPGVKFEKLRYFNDTVLVELNVPYDLSDEVNTICLPEKAVDVKQPCVTAGWSYESPGGTSKYYFQKYYLTTSTDFIPSNNNKYAWLFLFFVFYI